MQVQSCFIHLIMQNKIVKTKIKIKIIRLRLIILIFYIFNSDVTIIEQLRWIAHISKKLVNADLVI
jgi:hypothetical protein